MPHVYASISGHGYGHAAISCAVLEAVARHAPGLSVTVGTAVPRHYLDARLSMPFTLRATPEDFGLVMRGPTTVDVAASAARYRGVHETWEAKVEREAAWMKAAGVDLVLTNISALAAAAANGAGVPAIGLGPFTWVEIARAYLADEPGLERVIAEMDAAYRSLDLFIRPEPSMPPRPGETARTVAPVATQGRNRRAELDAMLPRDARGKTLGLLGFGGIPGGRLERDWPVWDGWHWIAGSETVPGRGDMTPGADLAMPFVDVMASVDLVMAKPGYGMFAEAVACSARLLCIDRPGWPETPSLVAFLNAHITGAVVEEERFRSYNIRAEAEALVRRDRRPPMAPKGAEQAAALIAAALR